MTRACRSAGSAPQLLVALGACVLAGACATHPMRFSDRPPVTEIAPGTPVPLPAVRDVPPAAYISDAYLRHSLVGALDLTRIPEPGDVNALDEVPRSTWWDGPSVLTPAPVATLQIDMTKVDRPQPPMTIVDEPTQAVRGGFTVRDAKQVRWEIVRDPPDRPGMRTGAIMVATPLMRALGWLVPHAVLLDAVPQDFTEPVRAVGLLVEGPPSKNDHHRIVAVRWPPFLASGSTEDGEARVVADVGDTPVSERRLDDWNDRVPHRDRRTLRALKIPAAWLGIKRLAPDNLRDVWAQVPGSRPPRGFLHHYLTGLELSLGADALIQDVDPERSKELDQNAIRRLVTLGLWPQGDVPPTQREVLALGELPAAVDPVGYDASPPFEPFDRCTPADGYWAAVRLASLPDAAVAAAVTAAGFADPRASTTLLARLRARRRAVVTRWLWAVTPLEVQRIDPNFLHLVDNGIRFDVFDEPLTAYRVEILDAGGEELSKTAVAGKNGQVRVPWRPPGSVPEYLVVRIRVVRAGREGARPVELHLRSDGQPRVVGIRH
jgi:hypothetical protein